MANLADLALAQLTRDKRARVFLDSALMLLWANAPAQKALMSRHVVEVRSGIFSATQSEYQTALQDFVTGSGEESASWCMPGPDGDGHLILRCQKLDGIDGRAVYALTFVESGRDFAASYPGLEQAFDLTKTEFKVLRSLLEGNDAESIARSNGVSLETIRSHIRAIYSKMGVNSREAMFRRAIPFRE